MAQFDAKIFNPEVFGKYVERIPDLKKNELLRAGVLRTRNDLKGMLNAQTGGNYITIPMKGLIDGAPLNYDGETDITATSTKTYSQSMVVVGRAKAWTEKDFSADITGVNFMDNVAAQVAKYWEDVDQDTLINILTGIFSMTGAGNLKFVDNHTNDITGVGDGKMGATTMNSSIQKACGDNKKVFNVAIMHSMVATNLENLQLLEYLKYTDASGITRDLGIASLNGKIVLIDDSMPVEGEGETAKYTTFVLGDGAFDYCDCGAKVPYEMGRDPALNGGQDTLYTRRRKLFAPHGISFTKAAMAKLSPTDDELRNGANWELVNDGQGAKGYIDHKAIPIARIISLG
jgi:hypothetical protein